MGDYEKLGVFYLGKEYDLGAKKLQENLVLYDSRDLVTHAVVVGMTGSGKTGLCIDIIEEAAIDGVPSILIDPKGDLTNLLLNFPDLKGESFLPWINTDDANRKGLTPQDFANGQASMWQKGLADWGQSPERIQKLRDSADFVIYTPGSNAGVPVSILKSFAVPPAEILEDGELLQERITTTVTSLLGLLNIEADPFQSREHILLSTVIGLMWRQGQDLDLATLITQIQKPPIKKIGVLDLESFYPSKDRFALVMALNNLLASPGFSVWFEGTPLDISKFLYSASGKPQVSIFSIAHLGDAERMFFVSLLFNQILGWMRAQPGTTSLRALVYMDEIFGFFPPVATPPSKQPLLTLLKQGRAFGLGIVLATQNPVDLDYKGLSNTGTWFIGRLQTERDKERVMAGLEGAAASASSSFNRQKTEQILAGLGSRVFLMNNVHEDEPVIFQTRWCLSYLRGPLTRSQIKQLMDPYKNTQPMQPPAAQNQGTVPTGGVGLTGKPAPVTFTAGMSSAAAIANQPPSLPAEIPQFFLPIRGSGSGTTYHPMALGSAKVTFKDLKTNLNESSDVVVMTEITDQALPVDWETAQAIDFIVKDLEKNPAQSAQFADVPESARIARNYTAWSRDFAGWLYGSQKLQLMRSISTNQFSRPGETERDFRIRLQQFAREQRDQAVEELRKKYATKIAALQEKIRKAQQAVQREDSQAKQAGMQTAISFGATLLSAFTGRKKVSASSLGKAATTARGLGRTMEQKGDVTRAKETVASYEKQLEELDADFKAEVEGIESKINPATEVLDSITIQPKKTDIDVQLVTLVWAPYRLDESRQLRPAW